MDPQSCTKCSSLPEDILMLACSHDLCLNCASDRLAFEMKKKKNANVYHYSSFRALSVSSAMKEHPLMLKVWPSYKNWYLLQSYPAKVMWTQQKNLKSELIKNMTMQHPEINLLNDFNKNIPVKLELIEVLIEQERQELQHLLVIISKEFLERKIAASMSNNKSYISASIANASAFVHSVSFMVNI